MKQTGNGRGRNLKSTEMRKVTKENTCKALNGKSVKVKEKKAERGK